MWDWRQEKYTDIWVVEEGNTGSYNLQNVYNPFLDIEDNINTQDLQPNTANLAPDFEPMDGWELVYRNWGRVDADGNEIPINDDVILVLYNKYESKLRGFVFVLSDFAANQAKISLKLHQGTSSNLKMSGILSHGNSRIKALDNFDKTIVSLETPNHWRTGTTGYWLHADFPVAYAPCICEFPSRINIRPTLIQVTEISLDIAGGGKIDISIINNV